MGWHLILTQHYQEHIHAFWEILEYIANTLVFLLSGVIIAQKTIVSTTSASELLNLTWQLFVLYIVLHIIRGISILSMSYILKNTGYGFDLSKGIVLWWSGLRGAIGLALGLMIENSTHIDGQVRRSMMFFIAGIAFFTLLVNGVTMSGLIQFLRLDKGSNASKDAFFSAIQSIKEFWRDEVDSLVKREMYEGAFKDDINRFIPVVDQTGLDALETNCKNLEDAEVYELKGFINSVEERFENKRVPVFDLAEMTESENVSLKAVILAADCDIALWWRLLHLFAVLVHRLALKRPTVAPHSRFGYTATTTKVCPPQEHSPRIWFRKS